MPNREYHPAPEDLEIEVDSLLASPVYLRVPINILVIDILLQSVSEEAGPGGPESIIQRLQPICKENLTREAVLEGEKDLSEDQYYILVEIVADDPADTAIALSAMDQDKAV